VKLASCADASFTFSVLYTLFLWFFFKSLTISNAYRYSHIYKKNGNKSKTRFTPFLHISGNNIGSQLSFFLKLLTCRHKHDSRLFICLGQPQLTSWRKIYWQQSYCGSGLAHLKVNHSLKIVHSFLYFPAVKEGMDREHVRALKMKYRGECTGTCGTQGEMQGRMNKCSW